jgi:hypothetical protein
MRLILKLFTVASLTLIPALAIDAKPSASQQAAITAARARMIATVRPGLWSRTGTMFDALGGVTHENKEPVCITSDNKEAIVGAVLENFVEWSRAEACVFSQASERNGQVDVGASCKAPEMTLMRSVKGTFAANAMSFNTSDRIDVGDVPSNPTTTKVVMARVGDCKARDIVEPQPGILP